MSETEREKRLKKGVEDLEKFALDFNFNSMPKQPYRKRRR